MRINSRIPQRNALEFPTRKSAWYMRENVPIQQDWHSKLYCSMLVSDLSLGLIPRSSSHSSVGYSVAWRPASQLVESMISDGLTREPDLSTDLLRAVGSFVSEVAQVLAYAGEATYEIVYGNAPGKSESPSAFKLFLIPTGPLKIDRNHFVQILPPNVVKERGLSKGQITIKAADIVHFKMPVALGGPEGHRKLIRNLAELSDLVLLPKFAMDEMQPETINKSFDFTTDRELHELTLASITKDIGWTARDLFAKRATNFYITHRHLMFQRTKALLRESILLTLDDLIKRIASRLGVSGNLVISGLVTSSTISTIMDGMLKNKIASAEAIQKSGIVP